MIFKQNCKVEKVERSGKMTRKSKSKAKWTLFELFSNTVYKSVLKIPQFGKTNFFRDTIPMIQAPWTILATVPTTMPAGV